jgi:methylmalonyl-CoA mutase C-terminal domain/subunit
MGHCEIPLRTYFLLAKNRIYISFDFNISTKIIIFTIRGPRLSQARQKRTSIRVCCNRTYQEKTMENKAKKIRILLAKPGLDGHDRGVKVVARALKDAGYEVIYAGLRQTPDMIATAAVDEAVDGVGLSILSGAHLTLLPEVVRTLAGRGGGGIKVFAGGIIPAEDVPRLKEAGVSEIFGPGSSLKDIIAWVGANLG